MIDLLEFEESGMRFQFSEKKTFYIEKTAPYDTDLRSYGVSSVECVTLYGEKFCSLKRKCLLPIQSQQAEKICALIFRGL